MRIRPRRLSLPRRLLLVALSLLVIPAIGYRYVQEMDAWLRSAQEDALLLRAQTIAALVREHAPLFEGEAGGAAVAGTPHVYVRPLEGPVQVDGYAEDWALYRERMQRVVGSETDPGPIDAEPTDTGAIDTGRTGAGRTDTGPVDTATPLAFSYQFGSHGDALYAVFEVDDPHVVYRAPDTARWDQGDHLHLVMLGPDGHLVRYVLGTSSPGWVAVQRVDADGQVLGDEPRIRAEWQERRGGYTVELRIPLNLLGSRIGFAVADVNDPHTRQVREVLATAELDAAHGLASIVVPSPALHALLAPLEQPEARIWLLDPGGRVLALAGVLSGPLPEAAGPAAPEPPEGGLARLLMRALLPQPAASFTDDRSAASRLGGPEVDSALSGQGAAGWRYSADGRLGILTAAHPVRLGERVLGAVAVEQTSREIARLQNRAVEILIQLSLLAFVIAATVLLVFGTRLSWRIRQLRDAAEAAIGPDGRVRGALPESRAGDEIGDLQRSFSGVLRRLGEYNRYLEGMAGKLAHELRTPLTVVRSSLDNLEQGALDADARRYAQRAREGVTRLADILTRMGEATRLEQSLEGEARVSFDLRPLLEGCVEGYRLAHPERDFRLDLPGVDPLPLHGAPELIAQMLDKLIANAHEFGRAGTPVTLRVRLARDALHLAVINTGLPLPAAMRERLFDSMVSLRPQTGDSHLGLGLYIVRLIATFHGGEVAARDCPALPGVEVEVRLPRPA